MRLSVFWQIHSFRKANWLAHPYGIVEVIYFSLFSSRFKMKKKFEALFRILKRIYLDLYIRNKFFKRIYFILLRLIHTLRYKLRNTINRNT